MPSSVVGGLALRKDARNCWPWVRSFTQAPLAWTNSPALIIAAWPTTVIRSRLAAGLDPQHAEPVLRIVERHPLHQAGQGFGRRCLAEIRHSLRPFARIGFAVVFLPAIWQTSRALALDGRPATP